MAHDWSDTLLDGLREQLDPPADRAVASILEGGQAGAIHALIRQITHNDAQLPEALPAPVRAYFEQTLDLPPWADPAKIELGEQLFMRYGLQTLPALLFRSLPECYAMADGAAVLCRTQRIAELTGQRVMETLQFLVDVMSPGGLHAGGRGVRSTQRVRLLHGSIRAHLSSASDWDPRLGQPINQEDMLGTLATFSSMVIETLEALGAGFSPAEQDAYMHCWNVVGYVMGIREDLLLHDYADGLALSRRIEQRHYRRSPEGIMLTRSLLDYADALVPGQFFDGVNASMVRHLCGDELADMLDVPAADWTGRVIGVYARLVDLGDGVKDRSRVGRRLAERLGMALMKAMIGRQRGGARPSFSIPRRLRERWGL